MKTMEIVLHVLHALHGAIFKDHLFSYFMTFRASDRATVPLHVTSHALPVVGPFQPRKVQLVLFSKQGSLVTGITRFVLARRGVMVALRAPFVGQIGMVLMTEGNRIIDLDQFIKNNLFRDIFRLISLFLRTRARTLAFPGLRHGVYRYGCSYRKQNHE
jgi:hypothetical protein